MIRLVYLLRRRTDLTAEKFQAYWRDEHGPLVASHATRLGILRYVQNHALDDPMNARMAEARGGMEPPYDGAAELWFEDEESLASAVDGGPGEQLLEDERAFIDLARSPLWFAHEYPQINPVEPIVARERSTLVKLMFPLRAPPGLGFGEAQRYWRTAHGPLIRAHAVGNGLLRYMQVHRFETPLEEALRSSRGTEVEAYLGHAEAWFDRSVARRSPETERAGRLAIEDERKFIDFKRSTLWIGKEHVLIDRLA
jgi:uncharacterized protein (TIGR02118 family)